MPFLTYARTIGSLPFRQCFSFETTFCCMEFHVLDNLIKAMLLSPGWLACNSAGGFPGFLTGCFVDMVARGQKSYAR